MWHWRVGSPGLNEHVTPTEFLNFGVIAPGY